MKPTCCAPARGPEPGTVTATAERVETVAVVDFGGEPGPAAPTPRDRMIHLPGGRFRMGTEDASGFAEDAEGPVRETVVAPFAIDAHCVSNARFAEFVEATGYCTEAERFGWSYVFSGFLPAELRRISPRLPETPWWCGVSGASWARPEGPGSSLDGRLDHPVVHVTWNDARAFCRWSGARLPTEAEWEYAARGGLDQARYPWGDELDPGGAYHCNIWRGSFPTHNTAADGYRGTAPVDAFAPNGFGLYNVAGNVWEWCADRWAAHDPARVMRGGSYLCHESYCNRYRVAARTRNTPDSSTGNLGFRCVALS